LRVEAGPLHASAIPRPSDFHTPVDGIDIQIIGHAHGFAGRVVDDRERQRCSGSMLAEPMLDLQRHLVLSACQFLRRKDFVANVRVSLGASPDSILMRGGSAIISPYGRVLAGPHFDGETILTADIDLNDITRARFSFDVAGHYSRPDVFHLIVNEAPMPAVAIKPKN
jgi:hypothetical protein